MTNDITMTHSGILHEKTGQAFVLVRFERQEADNGRKKVVIGGDGEVAKVSGVKKNNEIEIKVPSGEVIVNKGFDGKEIDELKAWLKENERDIMQKAGAISSFKHIFGD